MELLLNELREGFNQHVELRPKRPGILQILAPLYHEDGDMIEMFVDVPKGAGEPYRLSDHGMTMMRLSYIYEVDTPTKRKILDKILSENGIAEDRGRLYLELKPDDTAFGTVMQFAQTIAKVSSMQAFKREMIHNLFFEDLKGFVVQKLYTYAPIESFTPLSDRPDIEVDWAFSGLQRPIFLFGVRDNAKARLAALTCRELQIAHQPFRSVVVHEDFPNCLSKKDQVRVTNAVDKQFASLADFEASGEEYFAREAVQ